MHCNSNSGFLVHFYHPQVMCIPKWSYLKTLHPTPPRKLYYMMIQDGLLNLVITKSIKCKNAQHQTDAHTLCSGTFGHMIKLKIKAYSFQVWFKLNKCQVKSCFEMYREFPTVNAFLSYQQCNIAKIHFSQDVNILYYMALVDTLL